jgi:hypothetical protein
VFTQPDGSIVHPDWFSKTFRGRVKETHLPRIRLHDLRRLGPNRGKHGVPSRIIQERLGHHDPAFTARQYQDLLPGMARSAAETFATAIGRRRRLGGSRRLWARSGPSSGPASLGCSSVGVPSRPLPRLQQEQ